MIPGLAGLPGQSDSLFPKEGRQLEGPSAVFQSGRSESPVEHDRGISYDEGKTWPVAKRIKEGTGAYSCPTVFPDGTIGLVYETGNSHDDVVEYYSKISFARFNLEWLTDGKDRLTGP